MMRLKGSVAARRIAFPFPHPKSMKVNCGCSTGTCRNMWKKRDRGVGAYPLNPRPKCRSWSIVTPAVSNENRLSNIVSIMLYHGFHGFHVR